MNDNPLVSIVVITYNSAKYVLETLESAKDQTYQNIELIISDDCSTDNTVEICREWVEKNRERFVRTEIITVEKNTGIPANCNRGLRACRGEWVKSLAGDDIFLSDCIKDNMEYVSVHSDAQIVFSRMIHFNDVYKKENLLDYSKQDAVMKAFFQLNMERQLYALAEKCYPAAPTAFYKPEAILSLGGYSGLYYFEDWSMWLTMLEHGIHLNFFDKETIAYRHHTEGISTHNGTLFNMRMLKGEMQFRHDRCFKYYTQRCRWLEKAKYRFKLMIDKLNLNHTNLFCKLVYVPVVRFFNLMK